MADETDVPDAAQGEYDAALALMREGDHPSAQAKLKALFERYRAAPDTIRQGLAADAMCTLAVSHREEGQFEDAVDSFKQTSMLFAYNATDDARYVAAMADLLAAKLYYEQGHPQVAHQLLDNMSLRIMMEEGQQFRGLFDEAIRQKDALEAQNGFESGAGIRMERFDIGGDVSLSDVPTTEIAAGSDTDGPGYRYEKIESKFEAAPHSWQLGPEALMITRSGQLREIPYDQISRLALRYAPSRLKANRYAASLRTRSGAGADIDSYSYASIGIFEDKSFEYALLIHGLGLKINAVSPPTPRSTCDVRGGVSWPRYVASLGLGGFAYLMVLLTLVVGGPVFIILKVAGIVYYTPRMIRWIKRNRPRIGTPTALPPGSVPPLVT